MFQMYAPSFKLISQSMLNRCLENLDILYQWTSTQTEGQTLQEHMTVFQKVVK